MAIRKILKFPDQDLRTKAENIAVFDDELKVLTDDMLETMYSVNGIGLAATQIGIHKRVACLLYTSPSPRDNTLSRMPSSA